jgi:hypothetical protein
MQNRPRQSNVGAFQQFRPHNKTLFRHLVRSSGISALLLGFGLSVSDRSIMVIVLSAVFLLKSMQPPDHGRLFRSSRCIDGAGERGKYSQTEGDQKQRSLRHCANH